MKVTSSYLLGYKYIRLTGMPEVSLGRLFYYLKICVLHKIRNIK